MTVSIDEILALESHAVLHGDAAAQRLHALDVAIGNCFAVIEEPMQAVERNFPVHFFVDIQSPLDRLVVGRVQAKRPAILHEMANHRLQFTFHHGQHVRARHEKVFEVRSGKHQHFSRAVDAIEVIPVAGLCHFGPVLKVGEFLLRLLRKEVVSESNRQLAIAVQFVHNAVVVGIVLKSATRIDGAGDAEAVEFTKEEPRGVDLVFARKLWSLGQRGVQDVGIGVGDQQPCRISMTVALNLAQPENPGHSCHSRRRVMPLRSTSARSYKCITKTGVSGAAALISSSVGMRRSAN